MARPRGGTPVVVMARQVRTRVRLSFEVEGVYLSVESLELSAADIRIESISQHSRRYFRILPYLLFISLINIRIESISQHSRRYFRILPYLLFVSFI